MGFFKKLVIADNCAGFANKIFENSADASGMTVFIGGLFFTFQIYGDFSGYSDIAVGTAKLFGVRLMKNFNLPYYSQSIAEFWRRWHISLNKWFIDYIYIPLGANRKGKFRTIVNIMIVFALSGLWHGADWTFVLWGVYNGILISLGVLIWKKKFKHEDGNDFSINLHTAPRMLGTFLLVVLGWIMFRSDNLVMAGDCFGAIFSRSLFTIPSITEFGGQMTMLVSSIFMIVVLMVSEYRMRHHDFALDIVNIRSRMARWTIYFAVYVCILICTGEQQQFIYFQF